MRKKQYLLDVKVLENFVSGTNRVLDIGCSSGEFLDVMPQDWVKFGFETNKTYLTYLKENRPNYTLIDSLDISDLSHVEKFDIITLRGVIEHTPNHKTLIKLIGEKLDTSGILYICATPDFSSPRAAIYGPNWGQTVTPEHIHHFTPSSLQILLAQARLVMKDLRHPYLDTPYEDFISDSTRFLGNLEIYFNKGKEVEGDLKYQHAFPGNMMTAVFQKI